MKDHEAKDVNAGTVVIDGRTYHLNHHGVVWADGGPDLIPGFRVIDLDIPAAIAAKVKDVIANG